MPRQLDALLRLWLDDHRGEFRIDLGWKSDKGLIDLDDKEVFLLSEAIRTALIHDDKAIHGMVKDIIQCHRDAAEPAGGAS